MKIIIIILFGLLFSTGLIFAQTDFRPGYIIENTGDTLYGEIDYRGDLLMGSICKFKDPKGEIHVYSPLDILAFRFIDSKYYVSREIDNKKVFLEYLIKGKVNIYYIFDVNGSHYYLDRDSAVLTEIPYEEGTKVVDGKNVYYKTTKHMGILNYYMQDADGFKSRIQKEENLQHQSLIKLATDYHNTVCEDEECVIYEKLVPIVKVSIEMFTGITKYPNSNFINEYGGHLYIWAPRANEKIFFKTGIIHHQFLVSDEEFSLYKIPIQLQYIYRGFRIQPHVSGGVNVLSGKNDQYKEMGHTLSLNAGLNYKISNTLSLSTGFNSDFTPLSLVMFYEDLKFQILLYSFNVGLRLDL